jgi:hypothetical protein
MSTMQEFESSSTLFGGNAPFIEEQYEAYSPTPARSAPIGAPISTPGTAP